MDKFFFYANFQNLPYYKYNELPATSAIVKIDSFLVARSLFID